MAHKSEELQEFRRKTKQNKNQRQAGDEQEQQEQHNVMEYIDTYIDVCCTRLGFGCDCPTELEVDVVEDEEAFAAA